VGLVVGHILLCASVLQYQSEQEQIFDRSLLHNQLELTVSTTRSVRGKTSILLLCLCCWYTMSPRVVVRTVSLWASQFAHPHPIPSECSSTPAPIPLAQSVEAW
jgi:hypothetical protein